MFTTAADVERFRHRCAVLVDRGLSRAALIEALQAGPGWVDRFETMGDDALAEFSRLHADVAALSKQAATA